jgi:hypothetical protein
MGGPDHRSMIWATHKHSLCDQNSQLSDSGVASPLVIIKLGLYRYRARPAHIVGHELDHD